MLYEVHVFADDFFAAGAFGVSVGNGDTAFSFVDAADAFLHLVEGGQDVVQFYVFLIDDALQRIAFLHKGVLLFSSHIACAQSDDASNEY